MFLHRDPPQVGWALAHQHRILALDGWYALGNCHPFRADPRYRPRPAETRLPERSQSPDWGEPALDRRDHDTVTGADVVAILPLGSRQPLRTMASLL